MICFAYCPFVWRSSSGKHMLQIVKNLKKTSFYKKKKKPVPLAFIATINFHDSLHHNRIEK